MDKENNFKECFKGKCQHMCPKAEKDMRIRERLVHFLEKSMKNGRLEDDPDIMIKEYSRPAAGKSDPQPSDLRPSDVLMHTLDYLLGRIATRNDADWKDIYDFIFDRLRCVRQDMVIQNIGGSAGIAILEKVLRFHLYAGYRLCTEPISRYDPKINNQHTQECLKRLICLYSSVHGNHRNRLEFESVYLLYNLGHPEALMHFYELNENIRKSSLLQLCYKTSIEYQLGNYVRCLRPFSSPLCKEYPVLLCAMHGHLKTIQIKLLQIMNLAYSSKTTKYPVSHLVNLMYYTGEGHVIKECQSCGLDVTEDRKYICFLKGTCSPPEKERRYHMPSIDNLISMENLSSVLLGEDPT